MSKNLKLTEEQEHEMLMELLEIEDIKDRIHVYGQFGQLKRIEDILLARHKKQMNEFAHLPFMARVRACDNMWYGLVTVRTNDGINDSIDEFYGLTYKGDGSK